MSIGKSEFFYKCRNLTVFVKGPSLKSIESENTGIKLSGHMTGFFINMAM